MLNSVNDYYYQNAARSSSGTTSNPGGDVLIRCASWLYLSTPPMSKSISKSILISPNVDYINVKIAKHPLNFISKSTLTRLYFAKIKNSIVCQISQNFLKIYKELIKNFLKFSCNFFQSKVWHRPANITIFLIVFYSTELTCILIEFNFI